MKATNLSRKSEDKMNKDPKKVEAAPKAPLQKVVPIKSKTTTMDPGCRPSGT